MYIYPHRHPHGARQARRQVLQDYQGQEMNKTSVFRIRILDPDSGSGQWIRIRIQKGKNDPQKSKIKM